jgi:hypothetical protein
MDPLEAYRKIFYHFDITLFNAYVLYRKSTSEKLKYNQFRLVVAEKLLDGLIMPEYARRGCPLGLRLFIGPTFHRIYPKIL